MTSTTSNGTLAQKIELEFPAHIEGVDVELGLQRVLGNKSWYISMLRKFVEIHASTTEGIRQALLSDNRETALRLAHTVKSIVGNIGSAVVQQDAAELEKLLSMPGSDTEISAALDRFEKSLDLLVAELKSKVPPEKPLQVVEVNQQALTLLCEKLADLLKDNDSEAVTLIESNKEILKSAFASEYTGIRSAISDFNFDCARTDLLRALLNAGIHIKDSGC
jgi:HPt (histidine-containing phosphotransfer) domain-containing protein